MISKIYESNPQPNEIRKVARLLEGGGVVIVPTDTLYAFAGSLRSKQAVETIARLKGFSIRQAKYSLLCASLSQLSEHVRPVDKATFALLRRALPGPYTFILEANGNVPRNIQNANRTIGMRVPDNGICRALVEELGCPLVVTSVRRLDGEQDEEYLTDPELIHETFGSRVSLVIDGGPGGAEPSTVVDCSGDTPTLLRQGKGPFDADDL